MNTKIDRRVKYTKMVLKQSLLDLLAEKPIAKITVTDICTKADINRNTFYKHYANPEDLFEKIQIEYFETRREYLEQLGHSELALEEVLIGVCRKALEDPKLTQVILSSGYDNACLNHLLEISYEKTLVTWRRLGLNASDKEFVRIFEFMARGSLGIIETWLREDMKETPEQIAHILYRLICNGMSAYLANERH